MIQDIKVPEIGENVESGVVVAVHVKVGDTVAVDDTVIELETDKALVEIPSSFAGRVTEVLVEAGTQMNVGDVIARVESEAEDSQDAETGKAAPAAAAEDKAEPGKAEKAQETAETAEPDEGTGRAEAPAPSQEKEEEKREQPEAVEKAPDRPSIPAAPSIRRLARELGVDIHDISGSGAGGRINEADIKKHVRRQLAGESLGPGPAAAPAAMQLPDFSRWGAIDIQEMETVRRLTANSTAASWSAIPLVTQFEEADISGVMAFIEKNAKKAEKTGAKLTLTAILTRICAQALKRFPRFNASVDAAANRLVFKHYVHIGIAVDTPRGLLVPVIRDADRKSILDLSKAIADLAQRARSKKIKPDELEGGTFTISNQGGIGGVGFTPLVFWPQVAILGVSRSTVKPVFVQDRFEPRTVLPLALSYDHRIIDGADAARFMRWICDALEQPLTLLLD